ncbi:MAG: acyl-CoA dehydrogenase family protein, partial [Actinomycetota bacterium]|nr:acyl-CoA dehydrogenase family protein [Actinomycetota bacterium]
MSPAPPVTSHPDTRSAVRSALASTAAGLPLPGAGETATRWATLARLSRDDVAVGRLVEAHVDADAILAEVLGERTDPGQWWGVWAAEPPRPRLTATQTDDGWILTGAKAWCSGAGLATHALVTADTDDGIRLLAVALDHPGVTTDLTTWSNPGMAGTATGTVSFAGVPARHVGDRSAYLERSGFWHGAIGVAACWLGGAERVADTLRRAASTRDLDPHALAHLGAVESTLAAARWSLAGAAAETDAAPDDQPGAHRRALVVR